MKRLIRSFAERTALFIIFCLVSSIFLYGAYIIHQRQQPQYRLEQEWALNGTRIHKALFSPDDQVENHLIDLIDSEKKRIVVAIFSLTSSRVAHALLDARDRGVDVEIVADGDNSNGTYSKIALLRSRGMPLWLYPSFRTNKERSPVGIMHHKFIIFSTALFDKPLLWTGSYNFTRSANDRNQENVIITNELAIINQYRQTFEQLKNRSIPATIPPPFSVTTKSQPQAVA